jgi:hypothetical protein
VSDPELLSRAITAGTDGNKLAFARLLGHSDASRVHTWLRADRELPPTIRRLCRVIVAHPSVARWLAAVE